MGFFDGHLQFMPVTHRLIQRPADCDAGCQCQAGWLVGMVNFVLTASHTGTCQAATPEAAARQVLFTNYSDVHKTR